MTSNEFTIWLKGFVEACNEFAPTPKQWDKIKEVLEKVSDGRNVYSGTIATGGATTVSHQHPSVTNITYTTKQQLND
jgi:truncated hemoglobin YjbI